MEKVPCILLFGAGKSATVLIQYLAKITFEKQWNFTVADLNLSNILSKTTTTPYLTAVALEIEDENARRTLIQTADVVISLLPPTLHFLVAKDCLMLRKHLLTASYLDEPIQSLAKDITDAGLLFLGEMGLDPGIDHMSAMQLIDEIHAKGGAISSFKSYCGGLIAPEFNTNPWQYKITWNPRNIVTAGKAGAIYKEQNQVVEKNYASIFKDCSSLQLEGVGELAYYPNRDSLSYIPIYGLESAATFMRATFRYPDFCKGWQKVVEAGFTSDEDLIDTHNTSYANMMERQLQQKEVLLQSDLLKYQFNWLGLRDHRLINKGIQPISAVFQQLLENKWKLEPGDKDLVVMLHEIEFKLDGESQVAKTSLIVKGDDERNTAMAKTVGLPLGIAAILLLENKITLRGLHIPIVKEIYHPVLEILEQEGIKFRNF
jgi:saccharopine dehydrogenase-like NADP-dependent oxidoreductase